MVSVVSLMLTALALLLVTIAWGSSTHAAVAAIFSRPHPDPRPGVRVLRRAA